MCSRLANGPLGVLDLEQILFVLVYSPRLTPPPRELFGPNVRKPNPAINLGGTLGLPLGPERALLGSPWAHP